MNQMRSSQKNRGARNKNGRHKPSGNIINRVFESAGPEGKVRGTPQQIIDKYLVLARDAQTSGDRVMSENFLQHAEHYIRLLNAAMPPQDERRFGYQNQPMLDDGDPGEDGDADAQDPRQQDGRSFGQRSDGYRHEGQRPEGQRHEGQRHEGQRHEGQRHEGQRAEGPRHDAPRHEGDRPDTPRFGPDESRSADVAEPLPDAEHSGAGEARAAGSAPAPAADPMPAAGSGLETIDTTEGDDAGPVATPETDADEARPKPRRRGRRPRAAASDETPAGEVEAG